LKGRISVEEGLTQEEDEARVWFAEKVKEMLKFFK